LWNPKLGGWRNAIANAGRWNHARIIGGRTLETCRTVTARIFELGRKLRLSMRLRSLATLIVWIEIETALHVRACGVE
jgi:hypothetical protein